MADLERAGIQEQMQRPHGRYDQLVRAVEQTADSVVITNRQGVIEYVNPAFEETTGYSADEALGRTPRLLKSGLHDEQFYKELWASLMAGKPFRGIIINRKKSGQLYWSAQTISSMKDENGEITHFVSVLKDVTELRKQQEQEFHLQIAHEIQERLNTTVASLPGFDIAGTVCSATLTGGDYFDFIVQADGCLCVAIGDVSGHGFGAALVMAETRAYVRSYALLESDMGAILSRVNSALVKDLARGQYVTLLLARLDPRNRLVQYASAGHIPCYLLRPSGQIGHVMESTGPPLGLFAGSQFCSSPAISLDYGETLVLLTDGVTEAANEDEAQFGADRALEFIKCHQQNSAAELVRGIHETVRAFSGGGPPSDDITSVICKVSLAAMGASA
ncbi:MAG: SpoIIE family protein phosphatase [Terriglobia bacterium]|jgi:sigma-B regulation protein RsbU (phosphoserine phosphatase)